MLKLTFIFIYIYIACFSRERKKKGPLDTGTKFQVLEPINMSTLNLILFTNYLYTDIIITAISMSVAYASTFEIQLKRGWRGD